MCMYRNFFYKNAHFLVDSTRLRRGFSLVKKKNSISQTSNPLSYIFTVHFSISSFHLRNDIIELKSDRPTFKTLGILVNVNVFLESSIIFDIEFFNITLKA